MPPPKPEFGQKKKQVRPTRRTTQWPIFTGDHRKQDQILLVKIGTMYRFCVYSDGRRVWFELYYTLSYSCRSCRSIFHFMTQAFQGRQIPDLYGLCDSSCLNSCCCCAGFVVLFRDGEVVEAVLTCSFFFGTVIYGVRNQDSWERVERLQYFVWAAISGVTCWLVAILGQRVHAVR